MSTKDTSPGYPVEVVAEYPIDGEVDNDANALAQVVAVIMRAAGTDPATIEAADAWEMYVRTWKSGVVMSGQTMPTEWEKMVNDTSPLRARFMAAWNRYKILRPALGVSTVPNLLKGGQG